MTQEEPQESQKPRDLPAGVVRARPVPLFPVPSPLREGVPVTASHPDASREAREDLYLQAPLPSEGRGRERGGGAITALEPQQKREGRVNVYVDGIFAIGLFEEVVIALGLHLGQKITPERLAEISAAETLRRAKDDAYRLLSFRARSEKEIRDRLGRKGYEEPVIEEVLASLRGYGYVNDAAFAETWVSERGRTRGRRALAHELRQKGIAGDIAAEALNEAKTDEAEFAAALAAAVKRVGERPKDASREGQAKLAAFLQRRGFGWDVIRPVLADLYDGRPETEAAEGEQENDD